MNYVDGGCNSMVDYKKLYAYLFGELDKALTLMEYDDLLQYQKVKEILQNALVTAEDIYLDDTEE